MTHFPPSLLDYFPPNVHVMYQCNCLIIIANNDAVKLVKKYVDILILGKVHVGFCTTNFIHFHFQKQFIGALIKLRYSFNNCFLIFLRLFFFNQKTDQSSAVELQHFEKVLPKIVRYINNFCIHSFIHVSSSSLTSENSYYIL